MMVRPSVNNLHEFVAEENTCFFDICLPNYTADSLRRITYFKEITSEVLGQKAQAELGGAASTILENNQMNKKTSLSAKDLMEVIDPSTFADSTLQMSSKVNGLTFLEYDATPPKLPVDFHVADIAYRGEMK
jgi:hypothetical protein